MQDSPIDCGSDKDRRQNIVATVAVWYTSITKEKTKEQRVRRGALDHPLGQWLLNSSCPVNARRSPIEFQLTTNRCGKSQRPQYHSSTWRRDDAKANESPISCVRKFRPNNARHGFPLPKQRRNAIRAAHDRSGRTDDHRSIADGVSHFVVARNVDAFVRTITGIQT
jgi:hypothetical protein